MLYEFSVLKKWKWKVLLRGEARLAVKGLVKNGLFCIWKVFWNTNFHHLVDINFLIYSPYSDPRQSDVSLFLPPPPIPADVTDLQHSLGIDISRIGDGVMVVRRQCC